MSGKSEPPASRDQDSKYGLPYTLDPSASAKDSTTGGSSPSSSQGRDLSKDDSRKSTPPSGEARFACAQCPQTYSRPSDLKRHENSHDKTLRYPCPAVGCKVVKHRHDKLTDHMRKIHGSNTEWQCPVAGCAQKFAQGQRELFGIHVRSHRSFRMNAQNNLIKDVGNGVSTTHQRCPFPACPAYKPIEKLQNHLLEEHSCFDREGMAYELSDAGYDWNACFVVCPVCPSSSTSFETHKKFLAHLEEVHVATDNTKAQRCVPKDARRRKTPNGPKPLWERFLDSSRQKVCLGCGEDLETHGHLSYTKSMEHTERLLRPSEELFPFRERILKLCPEFGSHPVFDDVRPVWYGGWTIIHRRR